MADVFFFTSSSRKLAPIAQYRPSLRNKPRCTTWSAARGRRSPRMQVSQRAYVAHVDEPIFFPSSASSLLIPGSLFHARAPPAEQCATGDLSVDEDDSGGVSLRGWDDAGPVIPTRQAATEQSRASTLTAYETTNDAHHLAVQQEARASARNSDLRRSNHPRPPSRELWEEEDSRRLRFALDGDGPSDVPRFQAHDDLPTGTPSPNTHAPAPAFLHVTPPDPPQPLARLPPRSQLEVAVEAVTAGAHPDISSVDRTMIGGHHWTPSRPHEDALDVGDPRRDYDFADFTDNWRLRVLWDNRLPSLPVDSKEFDRTWRPPEEVTVKQMAETGSDMQGLRWDQLGPPREAALLARSLLHPYRLDSNASKRLKDEPQPRPLYRFRSFVPEHRARSTHYQLRNVLAARNRSQIYYSTGHKVLQTSLACPHWARPAMDLSKQVSSAAPWRITCLAASSDTSSESIVIAGGFNGEFALTNPGLPASRRTVEGFVTHAYNGLVTHVHVTPARRSGVLQAAFCSNDRQFRVLDTSTLRFTNSFSYDHAVNCAATSPDARLRVLVGDSNEALITDAERGDVLVKLQKHTDHGFACAWAPDGRSVATGAQDGKVILWDARNWSSPVAVRDCAMSSARSMAFTEDGGLVVAEDDDVVSFYGGPKFEVQQRLRFFGAIAGMAVLEGGKEVVVANGDGTVGGLMTFERVGRSGAGAGARVGRAERAAWRGERGREVEDLFGEVVI